MFLKHDIEFANFTHLANITAGASAILTAGTRVETPDGWRRVDGLSAGDAIATRDGGFARIVSLTAAAVPTTPWLVPGGALDNCSDLILPATTAVALRRPRAMRSHLAPLLLAPVETLAGFRGIRPAPAAARPMIALGFESEELVYAQTGALIHAAPHGGAPFYETLDYGTVRALITLSQQGFTGPDCRAAA